ncbi:MULTISPECIES: exodeoxyribonuclease VII large subunit [Sanguibacteroides]|nr:MULTISPECIES: exodeoxyribonuclease VII large subunit [Sanguibacteroides]
MMEPIGLYQLNNLVKQTLKESFTEGILIVAEIADIKENRSGHCYIELVEKREEDDAIIATARATIWAFTYRLLKPYFETTTGKSLQRGMKVLVRVEVVFHEVYGYSLNIRDIDPTFTIGDVERKRKEILDRLEQEGVIHMNRELELSPLPKVIAVISSPTAAGYGDFVDQLHRNPFGYAFHTKLFPAVMQGENTTASVIAALERVYEYDSLFDVVVIIRGGGSQTDLGSFDSYELAANVAQFPLPVIAGIGHERDETIVDRVAFKSVKTPTAAAAFLIEQFQAREAGIEDLRERWRMNVNRRLAEEKNKQYVLVSNFRQFTRALLDNRKNSLVFQLQKAEHRSKLFIRNQLGGFEQWKTRAEGKVRLSLGRQTMLLENYGRQLEQRVSNCFSYQNHRLEMAEAQTRYMNPKNVLERGFSITRINGKSVRDITGLQAGDVIETELYHGKITSEIKNKKEEYGREIEL